MPTWREKARPVIAKAIEDGKGLGLEGPRLRKFASLFYPFGARANAPYEAWRKEMKYQFDGIWTPGRREPLPGQMELFDAAD